MAGREYPERPLVGVGGVVLKADSVLLVRRAQEPLRGEWSLPGGLVEPGETLAAAVCREIEEETGLRVSAEKIIAVVDRITRDSHRRTRFHFVLVDFLCHVQGGRLRAASDASAARWVPHGQLREYRLSRAALEVIRRASNKKTHARPEKG